MMPFHHHYKSDPEDNKRAFNALKMASRGQFKKVWPDHWYWETKK